jgi:cysteine desulfurase family protein (TIGR01976 family)
MEGDRMSIEIDNQLRRRLREQFPALAGETIFLENAGGSQVPRVVADRIRDYMLSSYVQLGAGYALSRKATAVVDEAHALVRLLMGGEEGEVILGPSCSALLQMLADAYGRVLEPGSEIVVAQTGHEANVGPWVRLERLGMKIRWWEMDAETCHCSLEDLDALLSDKTALVAFPHVSNLLGEIVDIGAITALAHQAGAKVVVDGVAYAPHRVIDVEAWGVDWYAYSTYKVYGPHMGALWGNARALGELNGPNHFFIKDVPYQFELGGACHEGCAGILGLTDYLKVVADAKPDDMLSREMVEQAFEVMTGCEQPLIGALIDYLQSRSDVRILGPVHNGADRVGTVSFVHSTKSSKEITAVVDRSEIAIRHGHMYAYRLCERLGLDPDDGVVRISLVHYNTPEEIDRLIEVLHEALG